MSAGETTFASHPGNVRVNFLRYLRYFPWPAVIPVTFALAAFAWPLIVNVDQWWVVLAGIAAVVIQLGPIYWRARLQFMHGCLNPAIVLRTKPLLLAVYTDLSTSDDLSFPVIKVIRHPRLLSDRFKVGDRCVTVALYAGYEGRAKWDDFEPLLLNVATDDPAVISNSIARLPETDWFLLLEFLPRVPKPPKPGLYPLTSGAHNFIQRVEFN
jgi:hypothetical protein